MEAIELSCKLLYEEGKLGAIQQLIQEAMSQHKDMEMIGLSRFLLFSGYNPANISFGTVYLAGTSKEFLHAALDAGFDVDLYDSVRKL
jgi:hypothetical protein